MLLDSLLRNAKMFTKHHKKIRVVLVFVALYFFQITKSKNGIYTDEALHDKMVQIDKVYSNKSDQFTREADTEAFLLNSLSPNKTILIYGRRSNINLFSRLVSSIKKAKVTTKNIKIVLTENGDIEYDCLQYFCAIKLSFDDDCCCTRFFPLKNLQPNSDLLFISKEYFPAQISYEFYFKNYYLNNVNNLDISLSPSIQDSLKFLLFIRALQNLHSHSLGSYFYVPLREFNISLICLIPFVSINIVYSIFLSLCTKKLGFNKKLWLSLSYLYSPLFLIFFVMEDHISNASCMLFFISVNFRYGFIYTILVFIKNLVSLILLD